MAWSGVLFRFDMIYVVGIRLSFKRYRPREDISKLQNKGLNCTTNLRLSIARPDKVLDLELWLKVVYLVSSAEK